MTLRTSGTVVARNVDLSEPDRKSVTNVPGASNGRPSDATPTSVILECRSLRKSFRSEGVDREVISDLSLRIHTRSFVSIVGPSGVGKTTLLRCLAGLV